MAYIYWISNRIQVDKHRYDKKRDHWQTTDEGHIHVRLGEKDNMNFRNGYPTKQQAIEREIKDLQHKIDNNHITIIKLKKMLKGIK